MTIPITPTGGTSAAWSIQTPPAPPGDGPELSDEQLTALAATTVDDTAPPGGPGKAHGAHHGGHHGSHGSSPTDPADALNQLATDLGVDPEDLLSVLKSDDAATTSLFGSYGKAAGSASTGLLVSVDA